MTIRRKTAAIVLLAFLSGCAVTTGPEHRPVPDGAYSLVLVHGDDYESPDPELELGAVELSRAPDGQVEGHWWLGESAEGDDLAGEYDPDTESLYLTFTEGGTEHHLIGFVGPTGIFVAGHWVYWGSDGSWGNGVFRLEHGFEYHSR